MHVAFAPGTGGSFQGLKHGFSFNYEAMNGKEHQIQQKTEGLAGDIKDCLVNPGSFRQEGLIQVVN